MRKTAHRLSILVVALALLGAACGDDGGNALFGDADDGTTTTTSGTDPAQQNDDDPTTTTKAEGNDDPAVPSNDIDDLLDRFQNAAVRLTYQVDDMGDKQVMILSQDPNHDPPLSSYTFVDDGGKMIIQGDDFIMCDEFGCMAMPGMGDGGDMMMMGLVGPFLAGLMTTGMVSGGPGYDVDSSPVNIAGRDGVCITYEPSVELDPEVQTVRQCVDNEFGFTLLMEFTDRGETEPETAMLLLEFGRPQPDDFEPTGPVTPMPGGEG